MPYPHLPPRSPAGRSRAHLLLAFRQRWLIGDLLSTHQIAAEVIRYHKLSKPVWIEHYPKEATDGHSETFELVVFSSYEVRERAPYLGETRLTLGEPSWKSLDRESVEALVGQEI